MGSARTAVALYVAVALHVVALLALLLVPRPQDGPGRGVGLTLAGAGSVLPPPTPASARPPVDSREPEGREPAPRIELPRKAVPRFEPPRNAAPRAEPARKAAERLEPVRKPAPDPAIPDRTVVEAHRDAAPAVVKMPPASPVIASPPSRAITGVTGPAAAEPALDTGFSVALPDSGGVGPPGESREGGGGIDFYFTRLRVHFARFRRELPGSITKGRAEVRFTVRTDGMLGGIALARSSGSPALDAEAIALVERAQPLPPPPEGHERTLVVPISVGGEN